MKIDFDLKLCTALHDKMFLENVRNIEMHEYISDLKNLDFYPFITIPTRTIPFSRRSAIIRVLQLLQFDPL